MSNRNQLIKRLLSGLTNSELENLVRVREEACPIPAPRRQREARPIPTQRRRQYQEPGRSIQELIRHFEANPILHYTQPPRKKRTKITQKRRALNGYTKSFEIGVKSQNDPLVQLQNTRVSISQLFGQILAETKGFKFVETLVVTFNKRKDDKILYSEPLYINGRAQIVINPNDFLPSLELSQQKILNGIGVWLSEGSGWTISTINEHYINIAVYDPLKGNSYVQLPAELQHHRKGLINIKNNDNECFRWCHARFLNPQEKHPQRIKKLDREVIQDLDYKGIEFLISVKDNGKI